MTPTLHITAHPSPLGDLFLAINSEGQLVRLTFLDVRSLDEVKEELLNAGFDLSESGSDAFESIRQQLDAYFRKELESFDLPLAPKGTPFQQKVWHQLEHIPYGCCETYRDIAERVGKPGASRAVGLANNANPIPIVIPCHRVIGSNGRLVGFGVGVEMKYQLLRHEGYFML